MQGANRSHTQRYVKAEQPYDAKEASLARQARSAGTVPALRTTYYTAATYLLQGEAMPSREPEKRAIKPVALSPNGDRVKVKHLQ